ncbi:MAG: hypothetical protein HY204_02755 [Nitrospirae bacterium]|nr:hypothetical protein [Nitrospirota bacterium]
MRIGLVAAVIFSIVALSNRPAEPAKAIEKESPAITPLAVHAHRYQDFQRGIIACEVFGEIKNTGSRPVKGFTLHLEMLDAKGKVLSNEDLTLTLRVIVPGNAKGEPRAVQPLEIGNFIQEIKACPEQWMEGRIKYQIKQVQTE